MTLRDSVGSSSVSNAVSARNACRARDRSAAVSSGRASERDRSRSDRSPVVSVPLTETSVTPDGVNEVGGSGG